MTFGRLSAPAGASSASAFARRAHSGVLAAASEVSENEFERDMWQTISDEQVELALTGTGPPLSLLAFLRTVDSVTSTNRRYIAPSGPTREPSLQDKE